MTNRGSLGSGPEEEPFSRKASPRRSSQEEYQGKISNARKEEVKVQRKPAIGHSDSRTFASEAARTVASSAQSQPQGSDVCRGEGRGREAAARRGNRGGGDSRRREGRSSRGQGEVHPSMEEEAAVLEERPTEIERKRQGQGEGQGQRKRQRTEQRSSSAQGWAEAPKRASSENSQGGRDERSAQAPDSLSGAELRAWLDEQLRCWKDNPPTLAEVGIKLRHVFLSANFEAASHAKKFLSAITSFTLGGEGFMNEHGNLLPLPLVLSAEDEAVEDAVCKNASVHMPDVNMSHNDLKKQGKRAWMFVLVCTLNYMALGDFVPHFTSTHPSPNQRKALQHLEEQVETFLGKSKLERLPAEDWLTTLRQKRTDYSGNVIAKAMPLSWSQIEPALPPRELAGKIACEDLAEGRMKELLLNPELSTLPMAEWPPDIKSAQVKAVSDEEIIKIAVGLHDRGILRVADEDERLIGPSGRAIYQGAFGVSKGKKLKGTALDILRLIINLVPSNQVQLMIKGDNRTLPYLGQWCGCLVEENELVVWSSEDVKCCFYVFRLPRQWGKFFVLNYEFDGRLFGKKGRVRLTLNVVPMGWLSAVGVIQYLHRQLAFKMAKLPKQLELRRDAPLPVNENFSIHHFWQLYIDNYDECRPTQAASKGQPSAWSNALRKAGAVVGLPYDDEEKRVLQEYQASTLGGSIQGDLALIRSGLKRLGQLIGYAWLFMAKPDLTAKDLEIIGGNWISHCQFNRPVVSVFEELWNAIQKGHSGLHRWELVAPELMQAMALMPLTSIEMNLPVDSMVTASDASESGGGLCSSVGLSDMGNLRLAEAERQRLALSAEHVMLVEVFSGIQGARRALEVLGIRPGLNLSCEIDENAVKVSKLNYPETIELGDISQLTVHKLQDAASNNVRIEQILLVAGWPCQELSGLNAEGLGLAGRSGLISELIRLERDLLPRAFPDATIERLAENVSSMSDEDCLAVNQLLHTKPYQICPSDLWPVRRPRYYWTTWKLRPASDFKVNSNHHCQKVHLLGARVGVRKFLKRGQHVHKHFGCFPTLVRSIPRKRPPVKPAGIHTCKRHEIKRYKDAGFRYPPYQYKDTNLVYTKNGSHPPDSELRERLMMFRDGHTFLPGKKLPGAVEDIRCSLVGNSFHVGVVAFLLGHWAANIGLMPRAPTAEMIAHGTSGFAEIYCPREVAEQQERLATRGPELLARAYASYQTARGGEIRRESGPVATRCLIQPVDPRQWTWRTMLSHTWKHEAHINLLEAQEYLIMLKWRTRQKQCLKTRFIHLLDSQLTMGAATKHRSPSKPLHRIMRKAAAHLLAGRLRPILAFCRTKTNPADRPSRRLVLLPRPRQALPKKRAGESAAAAVT